MSYQLGMDIGGTFTDLTLISTNGEITIAKVPSNPDAPGEVIQAGIEQLSQKVGLTIDELFDRIDLLIHGTTIATNALLQSQFAKVGMITTEGFRDTVNFREGVKESRYDYTVRPVPPLVERALTLPVRGRILKDGSEYAPLSEEDIYRNIEIFRREKVEAVAVCLLWSIVNPEHEGRVRAILERELPGTPIFVSSEVSPSIREYPRFSTTALCAVLGPLVDRYIARVERDLAVAGYLSPVCYVRANGGVASADLIKQIPASIVNSGPATGPVAGLRFAQMVGSDNVITVDMGGTSFECSLVAEGDVRVEKNRDVVGYRFGIPMVDVHTLGTGGGSIAGIDERGLLRVGPRSAESVPGPACYDRGGEEPTVTDANVILGYLNPTHLLGGRMAIRRDLAEKAMEERIAKPMGVGVVDAARSIFDISNANMVNAMRQISTSRGLDARDFTMVVGGGASSMHAAVIAEASGISQIVIPKVTSVLCSYGAAIADIRFDFADALTTRLNTVDIADINARFEGLTERANIVLEKEGVPQSNRRIRRHMDLRYLKSVSELNVQVPPGHIDAQTLTAVKANFDAIHEQRFTFSDVGYECEIISIGVTAQGVSEVAERVSAPEAPVELEQAVQESRFAWFEGEQVEIDVYQGEKLGVGNVVRGPAVIEEETATILVIPGWEIKLDGRDFYLMKPVSDPA